MSHSRRWLSLGVFSCLFVLSIDGASAQSSGGMRNGLPPTSMDSFVTEAQEYQEYIYGDESSDGPPPYMGFEQANRINSGILGTRNAGLTTGHGSYLPDAWGIATFSGGQETNEWTTSGPSSAPPSTLPSRLDSALAANPAQFPLGSQVWSPVSGQQNPDTTGTPLPVTWNSEGGNWTQSGGGWWQNSQGDKINSYGDMMTPGTNDIYYADGSVLYENDPSMPNGTIMAPDGQVILPAGAKVGKNQDQPSGVQGTGF